MITQSIATMRPEIWQKELYRDVIDNLYFMKNGMMGKGVNNIIQLKDELQKKKGDKITFGLTAKLGKTTGVATGELEGNESKISAYSDSVEIAQWRDGIRLDGLLDEQKNAYDMRQDAKSKLSIRMQEFIEMQFFLKMGGVTNQTITDIYSDVLGVLDGDGSNMLAWSNIPNAVPTLDSGNGFGDRYLCADYINGAGSLASTDLLTPALISRAKIKAKTAKPKILPLRIDGKNFYIMFVHPWQAFDLKNDATYAQAQREAAERGKKNPIFTGALGVWDGVIIHEHEYVPFLDISAAGRNFADSISGTTFSYDCFRALLVGQQACGFAKATTKKGWVEKKFDFDDQTGFATGLIGGIQKITFNSKDYGVIAVDTAATQLV